MKAVQEIEEGFLVKIEVSPKSSKFEISGYNQWRDEIEVRITLIPQKGKIKSRNCKRVYQTYPKTI